MKSGEVMAMIALSMVKQQQQQQKVMADFVVENLEASKAMSIQSLNGSGVGSNVNIKA